MMRACDVSVYATTQKELRWKHCFTAILQPLAHLCPPITFAKAFLGTTTGKTYNVLAKSTAETNSPVIVRC